jgi:[ribosomal protein S18]-alanine N-acetyltransferase
VSDVAIKIVTVHDAHVLALVHAMVLPVAWTEREFVELLSDPHVRAFVAAEEEHDALVGLLLIRHVAGGSEVLSVGVLKEYRGSGVAQQLLHRALTDASAHGSSLCFLEVQDDNERALAFYQRAGFVPIGLRKHYYHTPQGLKDAVVMSCTLQNAMP